VASATMTFAGTPGTGTVSDSRLTQVGHGAWIGIATSLAPVAFSNPGNDRHTIAIATFVDPAYYLNDADAGPAGGPGPATLAAPTVAATAAVLVVTNENPNGFGSDISSVPAGYSTAIDDANGGAVCKAGIWYWQPDGGASSPAGNIGYTIHASGFVYATTIGLAGVPL